MASLKDNLASAASGARPLGFDPLANDEARFANVRLEDIERDPTQPRKNMGDLDDLKASIAEHGIMQPLIVSPVDERRYRIIAGERRYTAAQALGMRTVPALIRTVKEQNRLQLQLVENLHRKDLDPFEEAEGYQRLAGEFNLTHEEIARTVSKSRTRITEALSLKRIPESIRIECQKADPPVPRETLYLMARQETPEKMRALLQSVRAGRPKEERRVSGRKGEARPATPKPKKLFQTNQDAIVVVQSLNSEPLNVSQVIQALEDALTQARAGI